MATKRLNQRRHRSALLGRLESETAELLWKPWVPLIEATKGTLGKTRKAEGSWNSSETSSQSLALRCSIQCTFYACDDSMCELGDESLGRQAGYRQGDAAVILEMPSWPL